MSVSVSSPVKSIVSGAVVVCVILGLILEELISSGTALSFISNNCFAAFSTGTSTVIDRSLTLGEGGFCCSDVETDGIALSFAMFVDCEGNSFVIIGTSTSVDFSFVDEKVLVLLCGGGVVVRFVAEIALTPIVRFSSDEGRSVGVSFCVLEVGLDVRFSVLAMFSLLVALSFESLIEGVSFVNDACSLEVGIVFSSWFSSWLRSAMSELFIFSATGAFSVGAEVCFDGLIVRRSLDLLISENELRFALRTRSRKNSQMT